MIYIQKRRDVIHLSVSFYRREYLFLLIFPYYDPCLPLNHQYHHVRLKLPPPRDPRSRKKNDYLSGWPLRLVACGEYEYCHMSVLASSDLFMRSLSTSTHAGAIEMLVSLSDGSAPSNVE